MKTELKIMVPFLSNACSVLGALLEAEQHVLGYGIHFQGETALNSIASY
jgi:hypothetical protein